MAVRTLSPHLIFCDEIGRESEVAPIVSAMASGVMMAATAHGRSFDDLCRKPAIARLLQMGMCSAVARFGYRRKCRNNQAMVRQGGNWKEMDRFFAGSDGLRGDWAMGVISDSSTRTPAGVIHVAGWIFESPAFFTLAEPAVILQEWTQTSSIKDLPFPSACLCLYEQGMVFPSAWEESLQTENLNALTMEDRQILADLGNVLGSTGLQGQIDQLNLLQSRLKSQWEMASQRYAINGKLYRSLGLLGGLLMVILLW